MKQSIKSWTGAMGALILFVNLAGCMAHYGSSRTPYSNSTSYGANALGVVGFDVNVNESAYGYGMPYYGAFTGPLGPMVSPQMGGRWVQTPYGPRLISGGASVYQGTALDPTLAPAVVYMEMMRQNARNATTDHIREAVSTYPNQSTPPNR